MSNDSVSGKLSIPPPYTSIVGQSVSEKVIFGQISIRVASMKYELKEFSDPAVVKVYTRRWYILGIFSLLACHQVKLKSLAKRCMQHRRYHILDFQWPSCGPVGDIVGINYIFDIVDTVDIIDILDTYIQKAETLAETTFQLIIEIVSKQIQCKLNEFRALSLKFGGKSPKLECGFLILH